MRRFTAAQRDVCNGAQTGQPADEARTAAFEPQPDIAVTITACVRRRLGSPYFESQDIGRPPF
jgi:hypothetical protein